MKTIVIFLLTFMFILSAGTPVTTQEGNQRIKSFSRAKTLLHKVVYSGEKERHTFYCGCKYDEKGKVDWESCGYKPGNIKNRAKKLEWEHVVPAHAFGKDLAEWKNGHPDCVDSKGKPFKGRNCASKVNKKFQFILADMYNLVPAVGEINAVRSNYPFKDKTTDERPFGQCDFRVINNQAMPADHIKGVIARIYLYMDSAYPGHDIVHNKNRAMFNEWDSKHPVNTQECLRSQEIEKLQGNRNNIVFQRCQSLNSVKIKQEIDKQ